MNLLDECILKLGDNYKILSQKDSQKIFNEFKNNFPFTYISNTILSRIDWNLIESKCEILDIDLLFGGSLLKKDDRVLILWNECGLPVIESTFKNVIDNIDDITAVGFDTWIYWNTNKYVLEFYHTGEITFGMI